MSRIGKKPIAIPEKTTVAVAQGTVTVKGPLGELSRPFKKNIRIAVADNHVTLAPAAETLENKALWGTYASHIKNMIAGVNKEYVKRMVVEGIGYKADIAPADITLKVGFSHPVKVAIPKGIKITSDKGVLVIAGIDKELVSSFAAGLRAIKKPEPYKGKGIRFEDEVVRRKEGKKTA
ncbi:MAG: 50S ribosomal protein L6 [Patescibacteria group bacterium]|nr:50S ribosomal protein L6 [Patescibacteria group bacterium]MDE1945834.1 50S ribosomal protein L6 [Patescibacteria group bacterium]